jgi:hypothetical protein
MSVEVYPWNCDRTIWEHMNHEQDNFGVTTTERMKVYGGWIVRHKYWDENGATIALSIDTTFVNDPLHLWEIIGDTSP